MAAEGVSWRERGEASVQVEEGGAFGQRAGAGVRQKAAVALNTSHRRRFIYFYLIYVVNRVPQKQGAARGVCTSACWPQALPPCGRGGIPVGRVGSRQGLGWRFVLHLSHRHTKQLIFRTGALLS